MPVFQAEDLKELGRGLFTAVGVSFQEADLVASEMRVKGRHLEDGSTIHSLAYKSA